MFYHARVMLKPERAKESPKIGFEADMTREDVLTKIALPFVEGQQFYCGGLVVVPSKVEGVRFSETQQSSVDLVPMIKARRSMSGVLSASPAAWELIHEGRDITRELLDDAHNKSVSELSIEAVTESPVYSDRVFIVHGHDDQAVDQTELVVRRFGLTPIILREEPNAGRTVIEKLEAHTSVGFAIVLLTPDDVGGLNEASLLPRARQNVIWEWG